MSDYLNKPAPTDELVFKVDDNDRTAVRQVVSNLPSFKLVGEYDPILREVMPTYDFDSETPEQRVQFASAMVSALRSVQGLGLSANQVGHRVRMFVMEQIDPETKKRGDPLVCYNPEVIRELEPSKPMREGCLSYPGLSLQIKRPDGIEVSFQDHNGQFFELELFGLDAHCFQHELDHMNGILFTSRVSRGLLDWEREKQRKMVKKAKKMSRMYGSITA